MFDLAAVAEHFGPDYVVGAIEHCGRARCETALAVINKTNPAYVEGIIGQLMLREKTRNLVAHSREISRDLIGRASAQQPILNPDTRPHERSEARRVGKAGVSQGRSGREQEN